MNQEEEVTQELNSFLTFRLKDEKFAVEVEKVVEILEVPTITQVPKAPDYMKGVINLRGKVLPVIDTCIKFGLPEISFTKDTCIVVIAIQVNEETIHFGALVDEVIEVLEESNDAIQPSPGIEANYKLEFIKGMLNVENEFLMVLDIDKTFSIAEINNVQEQKQEQSSGEDEG